MSDIELTCSAGAVLIKEIKQLAEGLRFSPNRGAIAEGEHVAVLVDPRWNDDGETLQVLITSHAYGHQKVDWSRLLFRAAAESEGSRLTFLQRPDDRGHALFKRLPPADYRIRALELVAVKPFAVIPEALRAESLAAAAGEKPGDLFLEGPRVSRSADGRLMATVRPVPSGVEVAFETREKALAGARVAFALVAEDSGAVEVEAEVTLTPVKDEEGIWEGVWQSERAGTRPCRMVFQVVEGPAVRGGRNDTGRDRLRLG
ncbi:MAG: hypothetical protein JXB46_11550 [Candidatus Eisenbacteria bacterium]|nr:hypothetical protein [Candidatus Eisenbacteria bacterium]